MIQGTRSFKKTLYVFLALLCMLMVGRSAFADPKEVDKLRRYYRQHNFDFFGDLIADSKDFNEDEKRHAKIELLADDARTKALAQLEHLLKGAKGEMRAELLVRKATLLADRARTAIYFQNNPFKASKLSAPKIYLQQSINTFLDVERGYPNHGRMDVVVFSIAYNYGELRDAENSLKYYLRLVNKFGDSPLVGDARLAIAEIYFDRRKFNDSLAQLREIVKSEHPRLKNFALYKMAWGFYNVADLDSAIASLEKVIDGVNAVTGVQRARLELRKEALHDLVAFYAERPDANPASQASSYFSRVGHTPDSIQQEYDSQHAKRLATYREKKTAIPAEDDEAYRVSEPQELLLRLVTVYRDQGKHEPSLVVAGQLIDALGRHPKVPVLYRLRAEAAEKLRRRDLVLAELEKLASVVERDLSPVPNYEKGLPETKIDRMNDYFSRAKLSAKKDDEPGIALAEAPKLKAAPEATAELSRVERYREELAKVSFDVYKDFATFMHGEWSKTQGIETGKRALAVYDLAIRSLLSPWKGHSLEACYELRHKRAQLHFALSNWDAAAQDFRWLTHHLRNLTPESLKDEIAALEALLKEKPVKIAQGELDPMHQRLLESYDMFLAFNLLNAKTRETSATILAASARLYREYGKSEEALHRMKFYSTRFHDQKDGVALTRDVLASLERSMRWQELRDYSETLIQLGFYKDSAAGKELSHSREYASLRLLETLEKEKDWKKAATSFAEFAQKNPSSPFVSQALIKAANAALEMKDVALTVKRLEEASKAPDEKVRLQAFIALEPFYRKAFQWKKLLSTYDAILKATSDGKTKADATKNREAVAALEKATFEAKSAEMIAPDKDLERLVAIQKHFEQDATEFKTLRFAKSNNNPANNFKKKADLHAKLAKELDRALEGAPKSLKGGATVWANAMKAELLIEFADTLTSAALPAALQGASENDRKSYVDTLASQAKELQSQARALIEEASKMIVQIDHPFEVNTRLNGLLESFTISIRAKRSDLAKIWSNRPQLRVKQKQITEQDLAEAGLDLLRSEKDEDRRKEQYRLARMYFEGGETGFAYAIAASLIADSAKDEWAAKAARIQYEIDLSRLPLETRESVAQGSPTAKTRWDMARWLVQNQSNLRRFNAIEDSFSKDELAWFDAAVKALLRFEAVKSSEKAEAPVLSANH